MYFESVSMSSAKEKTFSTLHDRNIETQVQCVNMSSANENALIEHVHGILPERTEPGGVGNVRSALVITASAAPAPAGEGGRKGTWNSFAEGVSSSLKLEHMYWALLQHLADCYPIPDGSLPPCVHCHQHHDPNNCPHFRANLDQPFNKTPDNTLRLGIGLNLSEKLKAQEGSRSYIYCKPWKQVLNFAVVDSGTDEPWIGQLQLIFTCSLASGDNMDLAYVKWLAVDTVCATGCSSDDALADELMDDQFVRYKWATSLMGLKRRSRPPEQEVSHSVIELSSIISHAAITTAGDGQTFLYKK